MFDTFRKARSAESDTVVGSVSDALRQRYIRLLVDSLLNEIYLENEVRLFYIFSTVKTGKRVDTDTVRRIATRMPELVEAAREARQDGSIWWRVDVVRDDHAAG